MSIKLTNKRFRKYRRYTTDGLKQVWINISDSNLIENAIPSYLHPNPLVSWFFWKRLEIAIEICRRNGVGKVLDFGCGAGVMFPFFDKESKLPFWACDIDLTPAKLASKYFNIHNIKWLSNSDEISQIPSKSIDKIIALDVLEHIDSLDGLLKEFRRILKPNGQLIVSSLIESKLYKLGRVMSGFSKYYKSQSNIYHKYDAFGVENRISKHFNVRLYKIIYPPLSMFRIVICTK